MFRLSSAVITTVVLLAGPQLQAPLSSARGAALRFALTNGLEVPSGARVLALGSNPTPDPPIPQTAGDTERGRDAEAVAQVGGAARTARIDEALRCIQNRCMPTRNESVIVVNDAETTKSGVQVLVRVYSPSDKPAEYDAIESMALVEVALKGGGWVGVRNVAGPSIVHVRLTKR